MEKTRSLRIYPRDAKSMENLSRYIIRASFNRSRGWANELKLYDEPVKVMDLANTMIVQALPHHYPMVMENLSPYLVEMAYWLGLKKQIKKYIKIIFTYIGLKAFRL